MAIEKSIIYVLTVSVGQYDDHYTRVIEAFESREIAEFKAAELQRKATLQAGKLDAIQKLIYVWGQSNPMPKMSEGPTDDNAYAAQSKVYNEACDVREKKRQAEYDRLRYALRWDDTMPKDLREEDLSSARYKVTETPLS